MLNDGSECEAQYTEGKRVKYYANKTREHSDFMTMLGFIQGDGCTGRIASEDHRGIDVNIGKNDLDVARLFGLEYVEGKRTYYLDGFKDHLIDLGFDSQ